MESAILLDDKMMSNIIIQFWQQKHRHTPYVFSSLNCLVWKKNIGADKQNAISPAIRWIHKLNAGETVSNEHRANKNC